jgi:hypothetical protein
LPWLSGGRQLIVAGKKVRHAESIGLASLRTVVCRFIGTMVALKSVAAFPSTAPDPVQDEIEFRRPWCWTS